MMSKDITNNQRIARNTVILYFRMVIMMVIGLFTSRTLFNALGEIDYGLYNVVGGVVIVFIFINNAMSTSSSRFIAYELGKGNKENLNYIFSMSLIIHAIISIIIIILAETIGLWFIYNKMQIPVNRFAACLWVYHLSVFSVALSVMSVPYNSAIIAHERISAFAYISIFDAIMKLLIAYIILISTFDKLITYSIFIFITQVIRQIWYILYCFKNFDEVQVKMIWDHKLFSRMFSFASWTLIGNLAVISNTHGQNILFNLFGGPSLNAARAISVSVESYLTQFSQNFQTALNPQIFKSYANKNIDHTYKLINSSTRLSYYLLLIPALPILVEAETILTLWLKHIPMYSVIFTRLIVLISIINALSDPLTIAVQATGKVKKFEIVVGGLYLLVLPLSYITLLLGFFVEITLWIYIIISFLTLLIRAFLAKELIDFPIVVFFKESLIKPIIVTLLPILMTTLLHLNLNRGIYSTIIVSAFSVICTVIFIYMFGVTKSEKETINYKIINYKSKFAL